MIATTHGIGPFRPAIRWYGRLWVTEILFDIEDDALNAAEGVVALLNARATEYITGLGYTPQA